MNGLFGFLQPARPALILFGATNPELVSEAGLWWTILSASWLHGSAIHLIFNMLSVRQLAPGVAELYGPGRMVIIYTAGGVAGFALSVLWGILDLPPIPLLGGGSQALTMGASACITGLLGAIYYYGHRSGSGIARSYATQSIIFVLIQGVFLRGIINNLAHIGGIIGGYAAARFLDPLKPERVDHIVIALICLGASLLSVVISVVYVLLHT
jgi:rhomboid protease GluP